MRAVCPRNPEHNRFSTSAHVVQDWEVDAAGDFIAEIATTETTHRPSSDNSWYCLQCDPASEAQAEVYDSDPAGEYRVEQLRETIALAASAAVQLESGGPRSRRSPLAGRQSLS